MVERVGRLFLAVALTEELRHALAAHLAATLLDPKNPGKVVPPANWHITLRFLGQVTELEHERLLHKLAAAALGGPFELGFDGLGAFPRPRAATVVWLGITGGADRLTELAAAVEEAVVAAGMMAEERPFHPHLTLARVRPPEDVRGLVKGTPPFPMGLAVEEVTVYRSHLGRPHARYEVLDRLVLRD